MATYNINITTYVHTMQFHSRHQCNEFSTASATKSTNATKYLTIAVITVPIENIQYIPVNDYPPKASFYAKTNFYTFTF